MVAGTRRTVEGVRSRWVDESGFVLKAGSVGLVSGFDVECEKRVKDGTKALA